MSGPNGWTIPDTWDMVTLPAQLVAVRSQTDAPSLALSPAVSSSGSSAAALSWPRRSATSTRRPVTAGA